MVLVVLTATSLILTAMLQHNATQRTALKRRQHATEALCLADAGIAEALHRLAATPAPGRLTRALGQGSCEVVWTAAPGAPGAWDILSTGLHRGPNPASVRRSIRARAVVAPAGVRLTAWDATATD
jgi:hypothetical protein